MSIYKDKLASEYVQNFLIYLDVLFYLVPIFAIDTMR